MTCPFAALGLLRSASQTDVMREWRRLVLLVHPDKSAASDATERTQQLNDAKDRAFALSAFDDCMVDFAEELRVAQTRNDELRREAADMQARNERYEAQRRAACEAHEQRKADQRRKEANDKLKLRLRIIEREKLMAPVRDAYFKRKDDARASKKTGSR